MRWEISSKLYSNFNYVRVHSFVLGGAPAVPEAVFRKILANDRILRSLGYSSFKDNVTGILDFRTV
jgi:hypothetical protein